MNAASDADPLLDRALAALRDEPLPSGPPDDVRRQVLALALTHPPRPSTGKAWLTTVALAASLLLAVDLTWWIVVNADAPVGWVRQSNTQTWYRVYDNARLEISPPPPGSDSNA